MKLESKFIKFGMHPNENFIKLKVKILNKFLENKQIILLNISNLIVSLVTSSAKIGNQLKNGKLCFNLESLKVLPPLILSFKKLFIF